MTRYQNQDFFKYEYENNRVFPYEKKFGDLENYYITKLQLLSKEWIFVTNAWNTRFFALGRFIKTNIVITDVTRSNVRHMNGDWRFQKNNIPSKFSEKLDSVFNCRIFSRFGNRFWDFSRLVPPSKNYLVFGEWK